MLRETAGIFVLFVWCFTRINSEEGYFFGGSISYKLEDTGGKKIAHVELITGWKLGKGPCGANCSKTDVNVMTNDRRLEIENSTGDPFIFGKFETDYSIDKDTYTRNLTDIVQANYREWVIGVSEHAEWEQELMRFSFELMDVPEDISFDGKFWRPIQAGNNAPWHFQTKMVHSIRSDTKRMNNCPEVFTKTFYRIKLDKMSTIKIPMIDPDGDNVRCSFSEYIEGGNLPLPNGVTVHNVTDSSVCKVSIDASTVNNYTDNTWIAIPITFRDYSTTDINFGDDHLAAGSFSLSASSAQFTVQILENLVTPEFVYPTVDGDHMFIVYAGSTWTTNIYAKSPFNTTIDEFIPSGRSRENISLTQIQDEPSRDRVRFTTMSWTPSLDDTEQHILCIRAVDNTGVDTDDFRCFTIEVRADKFNHSSEKSTTKPYFIDIPFIDQLINCKVGATCLIPVFVNSSAPIIKVQVIESYTDEATTGAVNVVEHKGESVYKAILSFTHSMPGVEKICLLATDINNVTSDKVCISSEIEAPDPCLSAPCRNSAICKSDKRTGTFVCECLSNAFKGKFCENTTDPCSLDPCVKDNINNQISLGKDCFCICKNGFTGKHCEKNVNDCAEDACNVTTGTCRDLVNNFTCDCYHRYSGKNCTIDHCPNEAPDILTCPADGCSSDTCSGHGVCSQGGVCTCRKGYTTDNCSVRVDRYPGVNGVKFVPPSPQDKSRHMCFIASKEIKPCYLSVFVATSSRNKPIMTMETSTDLNATLGEVDNSRVLEGISNLFSADIVIQGYLKQTIGHYVCINANDRSLQAEMCVELLFEAEPFQSNGSVKFIDPTYVEGSKLVGYVNQSFTVVLYTAPSPTCKTVISTTEGVIVFPPVFHGNGVCVTESTFTFTKVGTYDVCFQSAKSDFQKRCFSVEISNEEQNACHTPSCQNKGHCFPNGTSEFYCMCRENYKGDKCEEGPCPRNDCHNGAYCKVNESEQTCFCTAGFIGQHCETKQSDILPELSFTGTAAPRRFQCVLFQPCSLALILTGNNSNGQKPDVSAGFVSPSIMLNNVAVEDKGISGSFQVNIGLQAKEVGEKDVCIQSFDENGVNKDELCFKVDVTTEVSSIYGFKDRPHFIFPSLPNDAEVKCAEGEPCHVIYQITPGLGNEEKCVSVIPTLDAGVGTYHIFTSCKPCIPGMSNIGNCSFDVSVINNAQDVDKVKRFCSAVSLDGSETLGEERCFDLTVISKVENNVKKGCQMLQCKNGGFCDARDPNHPICYCKNGFSGNDCGQVAGITSVAGSNTQSFIGDVSVPSEIQCRVDETCSIQFQVVTVPGDHPVIAVGYSDPRLSTGEPRVDSSVRANMYSGFVDVHPSQEGKFHVCLQTIDNSKTVEELCVVVRVSGTASDHTDMSKPHFVNPTIPRDSTVLCKENRPCHLDLHFTKGDIFGSPGKCPSLAETGTDSVSRVHIFTPVYGSDSCTSDVIYTSTALDVHSLCFQLTLPGKKGESRCFNVRTAADVRKEVISPCTGVTCARGGKCIADLSSSQPNSTCVCKFGFTDDTCSTAVVTTTGLQGVKNISRTTVVTQHFDSNSGVPKVISCDQVNPCCVVIPYHGDATKPPLVGFKHSAIGITMTHAVPADVLQQDLNYFQTCFTGPAGEKHRLCFQTTTDGTNQGMNVDEMCFEAEFGHGGQDHSTMEPKFTNSLSNGSSVSCQPNTTCHIPVETNQNGGQCKQVKECGEGVAGTYVFKTTKVGDKCLTDIAIKTNEQENTDTLCISAGSGGEQRKIMVVTEKSEEYGPCQTKHCLNRGFCNSTTATSAVCECPEAFTGEFCETDCSTTTTSHTTTTATELTSPTQSTTILTSSVALETSAETKTLPTEFSTTEASTSTSANTGQPTTILTQTGQPITISGHTQQPTTISAQHGQPTTVSAHTGQSTTTSAHTGQPPTSMSAETEQPTTISAHHGQPTIISGHTGQPTTTSAHTGRQPTTILAHTDQSTTISEHTGQPITTSAHTGQPSTTSEQTISSSINAEQTTTSSVNTAVTFLNAGRSSSTNQEMHWSTSSDASGLPSTTAFNLTVGRNEKGLNTSDHCDNKKAKQHAETMVKTGYASCFCVVRGKKVHVIKKRPVAQKKSMYKAAGFGAGGMAGTVAVGAVVFAIVNKVRKPKEVRRQPPVLKPRIHPQAKVTAVPPKTQLNF